MTASGRFGQTYITSVTKGSAGRVYWVVRHALHTDGAHPLEAAETSGAEHAASLPCHTIALRTRRGQVPRHFRGEIRIAQGRGGAVLILDGLYVRSSGLWERVRAQFALRRMMRELRRQVQQTLQTRRLYAARNAFFRRSFRGRI